MNIPHPLGILAESHAALEAVGPKFIKEGVVRAQVKLWIGLGIYLSAAPAWAATHYVVKAGDTLSQISADYIGHPIYGPDGSLKKALMFNPKIHNEDKIYIGDELILTTDGILVTRLATPEEIATAEAYPDLPPPATEPLRDSHPITTGTSADLPATEAPPHGTVALRASLGPSYFSVSQTGALGNFGQDGWSAIGLSTAILATFGEGRAEFEYRRARHDFNGEPKQIENFLLKGGYKFVVVGFDENTAPVGAGVGSAITWKDLTVISPLLGVHFGWGFEKDSPKTYRETVDADAEFPAWAVKDSTSSFLSADGIGGFGISARARIEKSVYSHGKFNLYLGLEAGATYQDLHFNGALGSLSGEVKRKIQIYQCLLTLNAEI